MWDHRWQNFEITERSEIAHDEHWKPLLCKAKAEDRVTDPNTNKDRVKDSTLLMINKVVPREGERQSGLQLGYNPVCTPTN